MKAARLIAGIVGAVLIAVSILIASIDATSGIVVWIVRVAGFAAVLFAIVGGMIRPKAHASPTAEHRTPPRGEP